MRLTTNSFLQAITTTELKQLTTQVNETIASGAEMKTTQHLFCAADLWKIQRNRRVRTSRRQLL